jgi:hypothetical protein
MVLGIERFKEWFRGYEDHYAIIGGTACDLLMAEEGLTFRGTKDIDLVLIVEAISPEFGRRFWEFVRNAGYEHCNKSTGQPQFYRFTRPTESGYPFMIELFSRKVDAIELPEDAVLTPLPLDEDISSLSAILLDDDYYQLLRHGTIVIDGVTVLGAAYLIPFKAKAWLDLTARKANGENVDSKNIRKHKNDVFRLSALLTPGTQIVVSQTVWDDLQLFFNAMKDEQVDTKQLGIGRTKEEILATLEKQYIVQ